jgi:hypothetical protein
VFIFSLIVTDIRIQDSVMQCMKEGTLKISEQFEASLKPLFKFELDMLGACRLHLSAL